MKQQQIAVGARLPPGLHIGGQAAFPQDEDFHHPKPLPAFAGRLQPQFPGAVCRVKGVLEGACLIGAVLPIASHLLLQGEGPGGFRPADVQAVDRFGAFDGQGFPAVLPIPVGVVIPVVQALLREGLGAHGDLAAGSQVLGFLGQGRQGQQKHQKQQQGRELSHKHLTFFTASV